MTRALAVTALAAVIALAGGCGARSSGPSAEDPAARAQALIEAGNMAYRAGDFELAARRFGAAAVIKTDDPAAYYGLGMALGRLGRDEDARVAYGRARRLMQEQTLKDMDKVQIPEHGAVSDSAGGP
jgi:Flp pilus assembly protein TadD